MKKKNSLKPVAIKSPNDFSFLKTNIQSYT